ncbi:MAG: flagellar FliJ family protein [Oscillospiraceae bacterium]|jgi:flagellar FliJ protein|nr:flagellar FliJ family protein [Oscillospiraceae bacterium]
MKQFHFTLARMMEFKNQILDREKDLLGTIRQKKNEIDQKIERYKNAIRAITESILQKQQDGTTVEELRFSSMQVENARKCLKQLYVEQEAMQQELLRQQTVVVKASQEVSSLEKLRDKQFEEFKYEAKRAEEEEVLEFVTGKLVRQAKTSA